MHTVSMTRVLHHSKPATMLLHMLHMLQGKLYVDALKVIDLTSDIVPQQLTNNTFTGGYGIVSCDFGGQPT